MSLAAFFSTDDHWLRNAVASAIEAVDAVHRIPLMNPIPVGVSRSRREQGSYHFASRPMRHVKIVISRFALHPSWTMLHELGHLLDNAVLNSSGLDFGTSGDPRFHHLLATWRKDRRVRALHQLLLRRGHTETAADRRALRYELSLPELWARTYVQWVVVQWVVPRSIHPVLIRVLGERRKNPFFFCGGRVRAGVGG